MFKSNQLSTIKGSIWESNRSEVETLKWDCAFCENRVASKHAFVAYLGADTRNRRGFIPICPECNCPTFFIDRNNYPAKPPGKKIDYLPSDVESLYNEARQCAGAGSYTGAVLICRKILMHIGVEKDAKSNESFFFYVNYLNDNGYISLGGTGWVDYIRTKGNEANHEIVIMNQTEAENLIKFTEYLLRFIYELPNSIPSSTP